MFQAFLSKILELSAKGSFKDQTARVIDYVDTLSDEDKEDTSFMDIIEDVMSKIKNDYPDEVYFIEDVTDKFIDDDYEDPYVKIVDLNDVNEDVEVKKLTVVFSHAFITEIKDLENLKFMDKYNSTKQLLIDKREKAMHEDDEISKGYK